MNDEILPGFPIICADEPICGYVEGLDEHYLITRLLGDDKRHYIPLGVVDHVIDGVYLIVTHDELLKVL